MRATMFALGLFAACAVAHARADAPDALQQSVHEGARLFAQDSFGSHRTWIPDGSFDARPMTCQACHSHGGVGPGTTPGGARLPSLRGAAARFPQLRGGRVVTLQMQLEHCIRGALGGEPPAADDPRMVALLSYLTALSRGAPLGLQLPRVGR